VEYDQQLQECKITNGDIFCAVIEDSMPTNFGETKKV